MSHRLADTVSSDQDKKNEIKGRVVLMMKNVLDLNDFGAVIIDEISELLGKKVSFQLVSAVHSDPDDDSRGKLGKPAYLENWILHYAGLTAAESAFEVSFELDDEIGLPGAVLVRNEHHSQFFLKSLTLEDVPEHGTINFICYSWVYPAHYYKKDRIFFTTKPYLPYQTPASLKKYREEELVTLRGSGEGELEDWERVYDYALYNDLGDPDLSPAFARPVLGGSVEYPYPRRGRTGRPPSKADPNTESRLPLIEALAVYVPKDERFRHLKISDFLGYALKSLGQIGVALLGSIIHLKCLDFDSVQEELNLYEGGIIIPGPIIEIIRAIIPLELVKAILQVDGAPVLKFPMPGMIKEDKSAWRADEEFARQTIAGLNPLVITRLEEFPPVSKLDPETYGNQNSSITKENIEQSLDGLGVDEAIRGNRLFILDYHDSVMPYVRRINSDTSSKIYATRTIFFLKDDGTLKPIAIELSLPHPDKDELGAVSKVFTPSNVGVEASIWTLAKAYVAVNDTGFHQLISHWSRTHAMIEPFVIASNRQLSVIHPIYKLLHPHFRYTMNINAIARQIVNNAGGLLETTMFPGQYCMKWSSALYKSSWTFIGQAVPRDLVNRGMAVKDSESPHGCRLLLEDYPYAVDALEIWSAIETWVTEYCSIYYKSNDMIASDAELQSWWTEVREKGHADKKDEPWWPQMRTFEELTETCTTIIWMASALHAAVNFGQYPYAGFLPNRPTASRMFMPEPNTPEYEELKSNPDAVLLKTLSSKIQTMLGIGLIELLSRHSSDELYLGQRGTSDWTTDSLALEAFERFGNKVKDIEANIEERNKNPKLKNRGGLAKYPYTLLYPTSPEGLTGKGVPNSTSI